MKMKMWPASALMLGLLLTGCSVFSNSSVDMGKIRFDLDKLDTQGMYGQPDGLLALSYEFCNSG